MLSFDRGLRGVWLLAACLVLTVWAAPAAAARVYVLLPSRQGIAVVETASDSVAATIAVDGTPYDLAVDGDGRNGYAAVAVMAADGSYSYHVSVLDLVHDTVLRTLPLAVSVPIIDIALSPDGARLYALQQLPAEIFEFDVADGSLVRTVSMPSSTANLFAEGLTMGAGHNLYALFSPSPIVVVDTDQGSVARVLDNADGLLPTAMALDARNNMLFVANWAFISGFDPPPQADVLAAISTTGNAAPVSISLGSQAIDVAVDPVRGKVFASTCGYLRVIDATSLTVTASLPVDGDCARVAFEPTSDRVYLANQDISGANPRLTVVNASDVTVRTTIPLSGTPGKMVVAATPTPSGSVAPASAPALRGWGPLSLGVGLVAIAAAAFSRRRRRIHT